MDIVTLALAKSYTKNTVIGMGAIKGSPCMISSIVDNLDGTHNITFSWKDASDVTHTSVLTVEDGETPTFSSVEITGGHRITFLTSDPSQSVSFDVMDGQKGDTGVSVISSNVDENNNLTLTLSNGNVINAGKIKAVTTVDNALSTTSSNPVENKVITTTLNNKVDKEMGKGLFSDEEKAKLANIEDGAQVNVLEKLIVNGQEATITDKSIALTLITSAVSNLQNYYLKTETYTKQEVEDLIGSTVGVTIEIVEQLPTEGQSNVIYFLPTETEDVYSQYIYTTDGWILIGSTTVDLSNYYTKAQVDTLLNGKQNVLTIDSFPTALSNNPVASGGVYTAIAQMQPQFQFANMPTASASNVGFVYQYTGVTGTYTQNMFYRCVYDDVLGEYKWEEVIFHATVTVDSAISGTSVNPVQNKVIKEALDEKQDIMQYSTMPSAQDNLGKIVQYIGTNTSNYTNGYFYKAVYNSESDVYLWSVIKFSADMLVDSALSTTSENPVQNKVITNTINDIQDVIPSEASSTNQLVDRDSLGTASQKNFTPYVSPDNADVPISSSVYSAITSAVYGAYHPSGSKTIAELTSDLLVFTNIGNVYKITEDGVTTDLFIGGAGQTIHTGDNAVVVYGGEPNTFLFDLQSGSIDLTPYQTKALATSVVGETTVEGALSGLDTKETDDIKDVYEVMGKNGAKNLFPTNKTYYNGRSYTNNGITFVQNDDGSITVSGVATADAQYTLFTRVTDWGINIDVGKSYILSGCPSGGSNSTYRLVFGDTQSSAYHRLAIDIGEGTEFTITTASEQYYASSIDVRNGVDLTTPITFYPMLRPASDTDSTYQPYAKTNQELTAENMALTNQANDMVNVYGAKNFISYPYYNAYRTTNGVDISEGSVVGSCVFDGTSTGRVDAYLVHYTNPLILLPSVQYYLSIKTIGAFSGNLAIEAFNKETNAYVKAIARVTPTSTDSDSKETIFTVTQEDIDSYNFGVYLYGNPSATFNNVTVYPMVRMASVKDSTYVPYVPTNAKLNEEKMSYADNGILGAKNLLPFPYESGERSIQGLTFSFDNKNGVVVSGTNTSSSTAGYSFEYQRDISNFIGKTITISVDNAPDNADAYCPFIIKNSSNEIVARYDIDSEHPSYTFTVPSTATTYDFQLYVRVGKSVNATLYPMIRLASDSDDTYQPYAKTNRELTEIIPNDASASNKLVTESDISVIGQIYSTTTLQATSIPATTDTVILQVSNLPLGTYIATGSLFGSTTLNNTGGIIQLKATGNSTSANTVQNSGFLLSGSVNNVFQITNTSNVVDVTLYCTNAQTVSSGRLMIVRIA